MYCLSFGNNKINKKKRDEILLIINTKENK